MTGVSTTMGSIILIFVLAISASLVPGGVTQVSPAATFFVTSPNVFRAGVEEKVVVTLIRSTPNVQNIAVKVSLMRLGSTVAFSEDTRPVSQGSSESFSVVIQADDLVRNEGDSQHMVLKAESMDPNYPFEEQTEILVTLQSGYVFVQTDKPIYTPNQDVDIKVMSLDQGMLPSDRELHVEIMDPSGTSVKRLRKTRAQPSGFLSGDYRFHDHPALGEWTVTAFYGPEFLVKSSVRFEVKEYVLPTFSVSIETPKYILAGADSVVSTIIAEYVFGKPVIGRYTFKYGVVQDDGTVQELGAKQGLLGDSGRAEVTLDDLSADFNGPDWFVRFRGRHFHANAIVHESATQFSEASINTKAIFVDSPYKFSTKRTVQHFKPGLNLPVKLDLTFANGDVAPNVPVSVTATATFADGHEELLGRANIVGGQDEISNTDDQGGVSMVLNVQSSITSIRIVAATHDQQYLNNQADISFEVSQGISANGRDYLLIRPQNADDRNLNVGVSTDFLIQRIGTGEEDIDLHYLCITGGQIVLEGVEPSIGAAGINLNIVIRSYMAPQMRLIVYYVTMDGSVIADSLLLGVKEKCRQDPPLSLRILPENVEPALDVYEPNGEIQVEVTAPNNSNVGLLAVDKAVYLLRDKDRMGKQKMYERMRSYDTGCGPGGGQNTAQIFKDCGMTVLTNAGLDVPIRADVECMDEDTRRKRSIDRDQQCLHDRTYLVDCLAIKTNLRRALTENNWTCHRRARILEAQCNLEPDQTQVYRDCCMNSMVVTATSRSGGSVREQNAAVEVRDDFRETWFFDVVSMPEDGSPYLHPVSTPSSITDWHLTAVSLSPTQGMCVEDETTVSVFQDFFIQLHLPYSVVRLEQTQVIATIFNYGASDFEVTVNFAVEEGLCTAENPAIRHVFVESKRAASATFIVRPVEVGKFQITVTAGGSVNKQDIVRKTLRVVPQGVLQRKGRSVTLNPGRVMFSDDVTTPSPNNSLGSGNTLYEENRQIELMSISLPESSIPDTESCSVKLIGNLLGTASTDPIDGLDHLVRQPRGCGEQTMIYLAPTLFVYQYLLAVGSDTPQQEARIYDYIADGVARELTYRQPNGAYAAWTHRPGSTWLTAFVVKVFSQANRFTRVDPVHVEGSINWLIVNNQLPTGAFQESQQVIHQEMIGAVKGETSMTAFVLVSLLESRNLLVPANQQIDEAIGNAIEYLVTRVGDIDRVYDKALVTYALALAESASVGIANENLWDARNEDDTGAVSFTPDNANYGAGNQPFWLQRKPSAIEIETSAYALLAQLALHDYQKAGKIALWLSKQQNYGGGFVSTQDTVVALQALAKYTERPEFNTINMDCDVATEQIPLKRHHIGNDNAKVQEEVDVSESIGRSLSIKSSGTGVAKANVELRYNTETSDIDTCPFHLNISAVEIESNQLSGQNVKGLRITVCTSYNGDGTTHMSIVDVGLYSGFKAVEHSEAGLTGLKQVVNGSELISSYEASSRSVIFYLDTIPSDEDLCFTFAAKSDVVVGNVQAAAVHVYDYYDPDKSCTIFYKPGAGSALLSTLCSENECICSGGSLEYCNIDPCPGRYTRLELERTACASHSSYALKIRIDAVEIKEGFRIYRFTVLNPIKIGDEDVPHQAQRQLFINEGCACPRVRPATLGGTFLLVGQKSLKFTTEQGEERYRYVYGPTSKLEFWPAIRRDRNAAILDKLEEFEDQMAPASACSNEN